MEGISLGRKLIFTEEENLFSSTLALGGLRALGSPCSGGGTETQSHMHRNSQHSPLKPWQWSQRVISLFIGAHWFTASNKRRKGEAAPHRCSPD